MRRLDCESLDSAVWSSFLASFAATVSMRGAVGAGSVAEAFATNVRGAAGVGAFFVTELLLRAAAA